MFAFLDKLVAAYKLTLTKINTNTPAPYSSTIIFFALDPRVGIAPLPLSTTYYGTVALPRTLNLKNNLPSPDSVSSLITYSTDALFRSEDRGRRKKKIGKKKSKHKPTGMIEPMLRVTTTVS